MSKENMKRKAVTPSELLAAKINGQDNKKIKKAPECPTSQGEATKGVSALAPSNPAEPTK